MVKKITNSGIGNHKLDEFTVRPVSFVVINGKDFYIHPAYSTGVEATRKAQILQMEDAIRLEELYYYTPLTEKQFMEQMSGWSMMNHTEVVEVAPNVRVGRNDPCPCGSRSKYKQCCRGK